MRIIFDTSALMSLTAGNILDLVVESFNCVIPSRVEAEIKGLSKNNTYEGNLAKKIFEYVNNEITVIEAYKKSKEGELECAYLANELEDAEFLITDDIASLKKLVKKCKKDVRFSTTLIYALCLKEKITKKQGKKIIEKISTKRNWKNNLIFEQSQELWKELK